MPAYPCMQDDCRNVATYFAIDNVPILGHVCESCLALQPESERAHFATAEESLLLACADISNRHN